jgi:quinoprotein glucose dehydrogenase
MTLLRHRTPNSRGRRALAGFLCLLGGLWLLWLGGTAYYSLAGVGLIASGVGLYRGARWSLWMYSIVWLATVLWSLYEAGMSVWQLEPRLMLPTLLGLYLSLPWIRNRLQPSRPASKAWYVISPVIALALVGALFFAHSSKDVSTDSSMSEAQSGANTAQDGDWAPDA